MKFILTLLAFFVPVVAQAFVAGPDYLQRTQKTVLIESWENKADITVTEVWHNNTEKPAVFKVLLPLTQVGVMPAVFWQTEGLTGELLTVEPAAESVYEIAQKYNRPEWLAALESGFNSWYQVESQVLEAQKTGTLKYTYTLDLDFYQNWYYGQLFLADGWTSDTLEINMVRSGNPQHWWANIGDWDDSKNGSAWARQWQAHNINLRSNLMFLATDEEEAKLNVNYAGHSYEAIFKTLSTHSPARVVLVLDTSGSVYGVRAERLQKALKVLLETVPVTTEIRLATADSTLEWLNQEWQLNSRENQKVWLDTLSGMAFQGRSNWDNVTTELEFFAELLEKETRLVLIGDFEALELLHQQSLATWPGQVLMLDFWHSQSIIWQNWWRRFNGGYVGLFNSGYELVESDLIALAWESLGWRWPEDKLLESNVEYFKPSWLKNNYNQWAIEQKPEAEKTAHFLWLPRWWANRKIEAYIRGSFKKPLSDSQKEAMASMAQVFGVKLPEFTQSTETQWAEIERLQNVSDAPDIRYWGAEPFYEKIDGWQSRLWHDFATETERPKLQLWSAAHKALFLAQPQLFAKPLSFGLVQFCGGYRCASIAPDGREDLIFTDTILWSKPKSNHWVIPYWRRLVWEGVVDEFLQGNEVWAAPMTRGQFAEYLVNYLAPNAVLPGFEAVPFLDLKTTDTGAAEALWLHQQGLLKGFADGTVRLEAPLKRIEALKLVMLARGYDSRNVVGNYDAKAPLKDLEGWTQPWGMEAYLQGLVQGYEDETLRPFSVLTQAEAFKLLVESERLLK